MAAMWWCSWFKLACLEDQHDEPLHVMNTVTPGLRVSGTGTALMSQDILGCQPLSDAIGVQY